MQEKNRKNHGISERIQHDFFQISPAKLNLSLKIGEKKPKGLHEIFSEMIKISLTDRISCLIDREKKEGKIFFTLTNSTDTAFTLSPEKNLIFLAVRGFFSRFLPHQKIPNIKIVLEKNIPLGSGLGGGSSNAATILSFLVREFFPEAKSQDIFNFGFSLGSDVPFFLTPFVRAQISGYGEKIQELPRLPTTFFLLARPRGKCLSTAEIFEKWDEKSEKKTSFFNDFESIVFSHFPEISATAQMIQEKGAARVGLSGSGSVVFGIFSKKEEAEKAKQDFDEKIFWVNTAESW